jgi:hypothetical protein
VAAVASGRVGEGVAVDVGVGQTCQVLADAGGIDARVSWSERVILASFAA